MLAIAHVLQAHTRFGRYSAAIGAGEPAAYASGVKVGRQKILIGPLYPLILAPLNGPIWVSKKSSGIASDLTDVVGRDTALPLCLVDTKVCAIDNIWSGLKFVIPKDQR